MRDMYFAAKGLAYIRGVDSFEQVMPFERFKKLYSACIETHGFKWTRKHFIGFAVKAANI